MLSCMVLTLLSVWGMVSTVILIRLGILLPNESRSLSRRYVFCQWMVRRVFASSLLELLTVSIPGLHLPEGEQGRDALWALLRLDERVECGRGYFLALKSGEKSVSLIEGMTTDIIKDMVVAFPRDVRRELANRYGCIRVDQTVYAVLMNCVEKGLVRRLPQALYCLPSTDNTVLMHALKLHDHTIRKTLEDPGLADYPLDDLSLLARYFDRQDLFSELCVYWTFSSPGPISAKNNAAVSCASGR